MARTTATIEALVAALTTNCGDMYSACKAVGVSPIFVRTWARDDKDVAAALNEAERVGAMALESEAIRRAVYGDEKGVYFKGARVGTEFTRSDGLLQTLLKGKLRDTYGSENEGGSTFNGPTQINLMPRAENYDQWLDMKALTLAARSVTDALPAPGTQMIDITPEAHGAYALMRNPFEGLGI